MSTAAVGPDTIPAPYTPGDLLADLALCISLAPRVLYELLRTCANCGGIFHDDKRVFAGTVLTCGNTEAVGMFAVCSGCDAAAFMVDDQRIEAALRAVRGIYMDGDEAARVVLARRLLDEAVNATLRASGGKPVVLRCTRLSWRLKGFSTDAGLDRWALAAWEEGGLRQLARAPFLWRPEDPPVLTGAVAEEARQMALPLQSGRLVVDAASWTAGLPILITDERRGPEVTL